MYNLKELLINIYTLAGDEMTACNLKGVTCSVHQQWNRHFMGLLASLSPLFWFYNYTDLFVLTTLIDKMG